MKTLLTTLLAVALFALAAATLVVWRGWYDVSATSSHTHWIYSLLEVAMRRSVALRAQTVEPPSLGDADQLARGAACYRDHCVQCHGGPGVAQGDVGKSLQPLPGSLVDAARRWKPRELYWITRHGIKMSGMPAWEVRLPDADLWALTAFLGQLPRQSPATYREALSGVQGQSCASVSDRCAAGRCPDTPTADQEPLQTRDRDATARLLLRQYACIACHQVPGVVGSEIDAGPRLHQLGRRERIAGDLPTTHDNLVRWIREPQRLRPGTAMPDMGVTEEHARRMAEYLLDEQH